MPRLNNILQDLPPADDRQMLLMISKAAVSHGRHSLAIFTAQSAGALSRSGSAEMTRSDLYEGAILVAGEGYESGKAKLEKINASLLDHGDRLLLEKALELSRQIVRKPETRKEVSIKPQAAAGLEKDQPPAYSSLLARAKAALADPGPAK